MRARMHVRKSPKRSDEPTDFNLDQLRRQFSERGEPDEGQSC